MTLLHADEAQNADLVGEETAELLALIEESFAVKLGNYSVLEGITVGELAQRIEQQAHYPAQDRCLSSVAFYELRRALSAAVHAPRNAIRPGTLLASLLCWNDRRKNWRQIEARLGLVLPNLTCPAGLGIFCFVLPALVMIYLRGFRGVHLTALQILLWSLVTMIALGWACIPLARTFPRNCATVGDLAKLILARNYSEFAAKSGSSCERGILPSLQFLIATACDLASTSITPETRIPVDLGID
jgi:hypothetical protein